MVLPSVMRQALSRRRYPLVEDHGTEVIDYDGEPDIAGFKGSVQPGTGETDLVNRNGAEIAYTIWAPPSADVRHDDLVDYAGHTYFVNGEPERWGTGIMDHIVIRLSRWTG